MEQWLPAVGYETLLEVSDHGRVRNADTKILRTLHPCGDKKQYRGIYLYIDGKMKWLRVHRMVLSTFVRPPLPGEQGRHGPDPDGRNNRLENLCWGTNADNVQDMMNQDRHHWKNLTQCRYGHDFTPDNVYIAPSRPNARYCKKCMRRRGRERDEKRKQQHHAPPR